MMFKEVNKYAVVSTGMMSLQDMHMMQLDAKGQDPGSPIVIEFEFGFFVYTGEVGDFKEYSEQVQKIIKDANEQDIIYVMFDRDGPEIEGLKVYDW